MQSKKIIYLDHAATTHVLPEVLEKMTPYFTEKYGNPSSLYSIGQEAKHAVDEARKQVAAALNCEPKEVVFTGSGTESDNLAIFGIVEAYKDKGKHIITSAIEHHAVLYPFQKLEKMGYEVTYIDVDKDGIIDPAQVEKAIRDDTIFMSIMYANNEVGVIEPIEEIGKIARSKGVIFHTDACQAAGYLNINVQDLNVDLLTINGGKIYGPKGVGALYMKNGLNIAPQTLGGGQEYELRAGTENVAAIVGMGEALTLAVRYRDEEFKKQTELRDYLIENILKIPDSKLNGHPTKRLPNNTNFCFYGIEGESILLRLDQLGICGSSGSACTSGSLEPSHVLQALKIPKEEAHGSLRLTLGKKTTKEELDTVINELPTIIKDLREISPLY